MPSGTYPRTLSTLFHQAFSAHGDRIAVSDRDASLTYRTLDEVSGRLAAALVDRGVSTGDRVVILAENRVEVPLVDIAVLKAGAVRLPLNTMQSRNELAYVFDDAAVEAVVCGADQIAAVDDVAPSVRSRIVLGESADGFESFDDLVSGPPEVALPDVSPSDLAGHYYTGGTTGRPKGVLYTHQCLVNALLAHIAEFGFDDPDVGVLAPPLSHSAGTFLWAALLGGGHVHVLDGFDPHELLATVDRERATWTFLVPTMLYRLLECDALADADLETLERVLYGAAPMRPDRLRDAIDRIGPVFEQFYGQTEVPNLITTFSRHAHADAADREDTDRLASAGTPCLQSSVMVVDDDGTELPADTTGEVVVTAPYTFDGYYENPDATDAVLQDGWVRTGDVGYLDEDGFLHLLDRKGDVIVSGGMNVYSAEVERVLSDHPGVAEVLVIGVPDDDWGEAVHAVVVPTTDSPTARALREYAGKRLASYKKPKTIEFVDDLPTTPLGKLDRSTLRSEYWDDEDRHVG